MSVKRAYLAVIVLLVALMTYTLLYLRGIDLFWLSVLIVMLAGGYIGAVVAAKRSVLRVFVNPLAP